MGFRVTGELSSRSSRTALRRADRMGVRYVLFLGEEELEQAEVSIKDFLSGSQVRLDRQTLQEDLKRLLQGGE